jgi:hypothetical protein
MGIEVDESRWPLVVVRFRGTLEDRDMRAYLNKLGQNLQRAERARKKTALLFDAADGVHTTAIQRKAQSEWIDAHAVQASRWCAGYAFALPSTALRGMLQAILWLAPMPAPHIVVKTSDEGEAWLLARLERAERGSLHPQP